MNTTLDFTKAIEIAKNTYWIGKYLENDPFQCHPYLIVNNNESILIDPGSMLEIDAIIEKINSVSNIQNIKYIILHHQDPDLAAAVPYLETLIQRDDLVIITHSRMTFLVKHYGIKSQYYRIDHQNFEIDINGYKLKFYTTPYCHSPGAFMTYDVQTKVLFSSDLFGGLEESWEFYAGDDYFKKIEGFHMAYMPSRDILNYSLRKIENLDIELIAPQHGSIITKDKIKPLIEKMKEMECGLYIEKKYSEDLTSTILKLNQLKKEFEVSLEEIKQLKRSQDGDYYLATLLIKPLIVNKINSDKFKIDFINIQKKSFLFKNKHNQLGGDLCYANYIKINNQNYILFFNGDAMGKSIQGTSGAIVMGTILNSISYRHFDYVQSMSEFFHISEFFYEIYNEIQSIFLSFSGAMMLSGVLGIIDEKEEKMYYINAEHPYVVLYRDGKASYIDKELTLRKFGFLSEFSLKVNMFDFKENDVIFIGSDGKDDLLLYDGVEKKLNTDPNLFLSIVEKNQGKLKNIINFIYKISEPTDDISIMRISFKEHNYNKNHHIIDEDRIYKIKIKSYIRQKNFKKALELMEGPSENQPVDILLYRGYCFLNLQRYLKALKYLLKAKEKQPDNPVVLKFLGLAYYYLKNYKLAKEYWEKAIELKPEDSLLNKNLKKVNSILERQRVLMGKAQGLSQGVDKKEQQIDTLKYELEKI
ncbi:MAG: SpoIIE family protein phosphatase [Leptospiraceae bacterium]|nr:SpoIIE family protein phosphatase [Leptospiraceae bacterium]MDW7975126.1 SpoIIE family protein phosphatase [Leptospiraceae bacterium]